MTVSIRQLIGSVNPLFFTQSLGSFNLKQYQGDGSTTEFDITSGLYENGVIVTENGILQMPGVDYTINGSTLTFTTAPAENMQIQIREIIFTNVWTEVGVNSYQATKGQKLLVKTNSESVTIILPAFPAIGDEVTIVDATGNANTNNIIVNRNANKILGTDNNFVININNANAKLVYYNETRGWLITLTQPPT
jgi:hypothetical protein